MYKKATAGEISDQQLKNTHKNGHYGMYSEVRSFLRPLSHVIIITLTIIFITHISVLSIVYTDNKCHIILTLVWISKMEIYTSKPNHRTTKHYRVKNVW